MCDSSVRVILDDDRRQRWLWLFTRGVPLGWHGCELTQHLLKNISWELGNQVAGESDSIDLTALSNIEWRVAMGSGMLSLWGRLVTRHGMFRI